jgi:uncharacterized protein YbjT (DUF2867 family)
MSRVLVAGATGQQGGRVVDALLDPDPAEASAVAALDPTVVGLTRDRESDAARSLADRGVRLVEGDLADPASLAAAFDAAAPDAVFGYTVGMGAGDERAQGRTLVDRVVESGAAFVLSTGGNCDERPGVDHVDAKADVEAYLRDRLPAATVLRPHTFASNFERQRPAIEAGRLPYPLRAGARLTIVDPGDVGRLAVRALADRDRFAGETIELAGEALTLEEIAAALAEAEGHEVTAVHVAPEAFVEEMGAPPAFVRFLEWQNEPRRFDADRLRDAFDFTPRTFREYLANAW